MKLRTRLLTAFLIVILIPLTLIGSVTTLIGKYQLRLIEKNYGVTGTTVDSLSNSVQMLSKLTAQSYSTLKDMAEKHADQMDDATYLNDFNEELQTARSYLLVKKDQTIIYAGSNCEKMDALKSYLDKIGDITVGSDSGVYIGEDLQYLVRKVEFRYPDGAAGRAYLVTDVDLMIPEVKNMLHAFIITILIILILTAFLMTGWIYRGVMIPVAKLREATQNITEGNLDFELKYGVDDELGALCSDIEKMRLRLKENCEEKIRTENENKELISNISHDLKTPVTTIKGYAEGILDGVAGTPEKQKKYVQTIYNKAVEMNKLINELTLYSRIDRNRIPYNFSMMDVAGFFEDCADDLKVELDAKNFEFTYYNYVAADVKVIADAEQIARVIHNIVNNSVKYMDKEHGKINLRVKDVGDFIQVELEDNGKGIDGKALPYIFDRFYRTDSSRNSNTGGSGIGLSIVKKIIEDHGGKIWVTSKLATGTTMYFVLRKYQEVPADE